MVVIETSLETKLVAGGNGCTGEAAPGHEPTLVAEALDLRRAHGVVLEQELRTIRRRQLEPVEPLDPVALGPDGGKPGLATERSEVADAVVVEHDSPEP